jgi:diketogulonate reductase-like aldo/keto reductase
MSSHPPFLYGTAWKEQDTARLTRFAVCAGFRGIDTANQRKHYFEAAVGDAIKALWDEGVCTREDLFLQTKFTYRRGQDDRLPYDEHADLTTQVGQSFRSSLKHLHTDRIDAYLLHGPASATGFKNDDWQVWQAMEQLHDAGKALTLGISNVNARQLEKLIRGARVPPAFVQNRCYARTRWDADVRQICRKNNIVYQGFSLLTANRAGLAHHDVQTMATRHDVTMPQLVFAFARDVGILPLTGTSSETHMRQDLASFEVELTADDVRILEGIES